MNETIINTASKESPEFQACAGKSSVPHRIPFDIFLFSMALIVLNTHLLKDGFSSSMIFLPSSFKSGEWWRLLTYPFVHITWYHLILDAGAFFLLYKELNYKNPLINICCVLVCATASLAAALIASPMIYSIGLCGLSGIAHGLMALSGLEMMGRNKNFKTGMIFFLIVAAKSIYETIAGDVLFSFMHLGMCGIPLAASHAGGVLGGILSYCGIRLFRARTIYCGYSQKTL